MKILLADDHTLFRETIVEYIKRKLPQAILTSFEDFSGVETALDRDQDWDLVLLDYQMPGMEDMSAFSYVRDTYPSIKVALMSGIAKPDDVRRAIDSGAVGYFPKTLPGKDFVLGIKDVISGNVFIPVDNNTNEPLEAYAGQDVEDVKRSQNYTVTSDLKITPREHDVLELLMRGQSNKEIANTLCVQEVTVKLHVRGLCQKLGAQNRTQAALKARDLGLKRKS